MKILAAVCLMCFLCLFKMLSETQISVSNSSAVELFLKWKTPLIAVCVHISHHILNNIWSHYNISYARLWCFQFSSGDKLDVYVLVICIFCIWFDH